MNSTKNLRSKIVPIIGNYFSFFRDYIWIGVLWGSKLSHILEFYGTRDQGNWEGKFSTCWDFFSHLIPFYFGKDTNDFFSWRHQFRKVFNVLSKPIFLLTGSANTSHFSFSPLPDHHLSPSMFPVMPCILVTLFSVLTTRTYWTPASSEFALPWCL